MSNNKCKKVIVRVNKTPFKNENESIINNVSNIPQLQNGDELIVEGTENGNKLTGIHIDEDTNTYMFKQRTPLASGGYIEESCNVPYGSPQNMIQDILYLAELKLKQKEIAKRLGVSQSFVSVTLDRYYY